MRKQTKLVAVLSTAALLAVGASMTSFAYGWTEEDGTWVYLDKDGERVTESWKKSVDNWFYLDDNGEMATDMLIEDDDDYYYVNEDGAMMRNAWIAIENEEAGEDDEPDYYWYYFQANGKAYKKADGGSSLSRKTINGKKYAFDEEGRMLYGWVNADSERVTEDDAWQTCNYYFGDEDDGAMSTGWRLISIVADDADDAQPGDQYWDEDQDRWFWFNSAGKKQTNSTDKKINGKRYGFDEYGRMVSSWYTTGTAAVASQGQAEYTNDFMYFSSPEDGARYTKGWFKVVPGYYLDKGKYDEDSEKWYYADGDGNLVAGEFKKINSKKYAFDQYGRMIDGLKLLTVSENSVLASKGFDDEAEFNEIVLEGGLDENQAIYYFGSGSDGAMKTGRQTVTLDGENFTFKFQDTSELKGQGINGIDEKKLYVGGKLIKADKDDKYMFATYVDGAYDVLSVKDLKDEAIYEEKTTEKVWAWKVAADVDVANLYMINASGTISTKDGAKNGDEYKFYFEKNADGKEVLSYITLEK